jgi:hypothetical protein
MNRRMMFCWRWPTSLAVASLLIVLALWPTTRPTPVPGGVCQVGTIAQGAQGQLLTCVDQNVWRLAR